MTLSLKGGIMKTLTVFLVVLMAGVCHAGLIVIVGPDGGKGGLSVDLTDKFDPQEFLDHGPPKVLPPEPRPAIPVPNIHRGQGYFKGQRDFKGQGNFKGQKNFKGQRGQRGRRGHRGIVASVTGPSSQSSHAPEPSTMILLGSGLIGIAVLGRKKFQKK